MLINGKTVDDGPIAKNTIYVIRKRRDIYFIEPQENDEDDKIIISYDLKPKQYGIFVHEYRPGFINKNNIKTSDILILVIDEDEKKYSSWILDVKVTVGGEDVIFKLLEQLCDSYKHKNSIGAYLPELKEEEHIGFITRDYQENRIRMKIIEKEEYVNRERRNMEKMPPSMKNSIQIKILKMEKDVKILKDFLNGYIEIRNTLHPIEKYMSVREGNENICRLNVFV